MKKGIDLMEAKNSTWGKTLSILIAIVMAISVFTPISLAYAAEQAAAAIEQEQEDENGTTSEDSNDASKTKDAAKEDNTESSDKVEKTDSKKTEKTSNATLDDFYAALDEMGDADDEAAILSVLKKIESVYKKLSKEDKASVADEWAYVKNYRKSVEAGNPDEGIETLYTEPLSGYTAHDTFYYNGSPECYLYLGIRPNNIKGSFTNPAENVSVKVGETGSAQRLYTHSTSCSRCGTILHEETAEWITVKTDSSNYFKNSNTDVVNNDSITWSLGGFIEEDNGDMGYGGLPALNIGFTGAKPGKATLSFKTWQEYYYNYVNQYGWWYCTSCSQRYDKINFNGWVQDDETINVTVNADYALNYDTQGGSKVADTTKTIANTSADLTVTSTVPTKEGYTFKGWNTKADGTGKTYKAGDEVALYWSEGYGSEANPVSQTLYAQWEKDAQDVNYRIDREYWINGEKVATVTGAIETGKVDEVLVGSVLDEENPGWRTRRVESEKRTFDFAGSDPESLTITADGENVITLKYEINDPVEKTYTVIYTDGADGAVFGDESHGNLKEGDATPEFEGSTDREGYTFQGWAPAAKDTVDPDMANENGEIIYIATWLKDKEPEPEMMIVQWVKGYGSATSATIKHITIPVDSDYEDEYPADPTREGYKFAGWSKPVESAAGDGQKVITITAQWKHIHNFQPKLDDDGNYIWVQAPDCINDGTATYVCSCGEEKTETVENSKLGHNFDGLVWDDDCDSHEAADCTTHTKLCKNCNGKLDGGKQTETHRYAPWWVLEKPATKDEAGSQSLTCVDCGHKIIQEIPKLGTVTISVQFVDEDGYVVKVEDPIELETGRGYDVSDLVDNIPDGYEANGEPYGADVSGVADANKTINVPVKKVVVEQPATPSPTPGPTNPTPGTPQPTPAPTPAPNVLTPIATPFAPIVAPAAAPAAPAAADEATIEDDANPLAEAPEEQVIADDENALAGFDDPHCWTHWLMIFGATATIVYCGCVIVRRRNSIKKFDDFENEVLGIGEKRTVEAAQRRAAYNAYQSI